MDGETHHVVERDRANALFKEGHALGELEQRKHDAAHLARHRPAQLGLVEHASGDERLAQAALLVLHQRRGAREVLGADGARCHQRLAETILLQVAGGEDDAAVVEEDRLDHRAIVVLQVTALALGGEAPEGRGDRRCREIGEHREGQLSCSTTPRSQQEAHGRRMQRLKRRLRSHDLAPAIVGWMDRASSADVLGQCVAPLTTGFLEAQLHHRRQQSVRDE